ncbi:hypothetical protein BKA80DRAFT_265750 [Phyllosticta citrichinensis]
MRTPLRLGTLASAAVLLMILWTIFHHSDYIKDRWGKLDSFKGSISKGMSHLGSSGSKTTSINPKFIGFGTPAPRPDPSQSWPAAIQDAGERPPKMTQDPSTQREGSAEISPATQDDAIPEQVDSDQASPNSPEAGNTAGNPIVDTEDLSENDSLSEESVEDTGDEDAEDLADSPSDYMEAVPDKIVVMAKTQKDDTSWVADELPELVALHLRREFRLCFSSWKSAIYSVDDEDAILKTPMNKGKEVSFTLSQGSVQD